LQVQGYVKPKKNCLIIGTDDVYAATSNEQDKTKFNLKSAGMLCKAEKCSYSGCEINIFLLMLKIKLHLYLPAMAFSSK
jgi:hypothetical protein